MRKEIKQYIQLWLVCAIFVVLHISGCDDPVDKPQSLLADAGGDTDAYTTTRDDDDDGDDIQRTNEESAGVFDIDDYQIHINTPHVNNLFSAPDDSIWVLAKYNVPTHVPYNMKYAESPIDTLILHCIAACGDSEKLVMTQKCGWFFNWESSLCQSISLKKTESSYESGNGVLEFLTCGSSWRLVYYDTHPDSNNTNVRLINNDIPFLCVEHIELYGYTYELYEGIWVMSHTSDPENWYTVTKSPIYLSLTSESSEQELENLCDSLGVSIKEQNTPSPYYRITIPPEKDTVSMIQKFSEHPIISFVAAYGSGYFD